MSCQFPVRTLVLRKISLEISTDADTTSPPAAGAGGAPEGAVLQGLLPPEALPCLMTEPILGLWCYAHWMGGGVICCLA